MSLLDRLPDCFLYRHQKCEVLFQFQLLPFGLYRVALGDPCFVSSSHLSHLPSSQSTSPLALRTLFPLRSPSYNVPLILNHPRCLNF